MLLRITLAINYVYSKCLNSTIVININVCILLEFCAFSARVLVFCIGGFWCCFFVVVVCFSFQEDYYLNLNPYNKDYYYYYF